MRGFTALLRPRTCSQRAQTSFGPRACGSTSGGTRPHVSAFRACLACADWHRFTTDCANLRDRSLRGGRPVVERLVVTYSCWTRLDFVQPWLARQLRRARARSSFASTVLAAAGASSTVPASAGFLTGGGHCVRRGLTTLRHVSLDRSSSHAGLAQWAAGWPARLPVGIFNPAHRAAILSTDRPGDSVPQFKPQSVCSVPVLHWQSARLSIGTVFAACRVGRALDRRAAFVDPLMADRPPVQCTTRQL